MRKFAKRMLYLLAGLYLAVLILSFFSDSLIFLPHPSSYQDNPGILKLTTRKGKKISAIYLPNPEARFTLLVSHGNAEDLGDDRSWLEDLRQVGFSVLAYDYEGYGTSEGRPGEQAAYDDEDATYEYLASVLHTAPDRVIIFGRSVGSGPAVHLAARRSVAGLILQSPFVSAFRVLTRIPLLPYDKFPNSRDIRKVYCPVLIIHGDSDTVIPPWHGRKLFALANEPKRFVSVAGADHNDLDAVAGKAYATILQEFARTISDHSAMKSTQAL